MQDSPTDERNLFARPGPVAACFRGLHAQVAARASELTSAQLADAVCKHVHKSNAKHIVVIFLLNESIS